MTTVANALREGAARLPGDEARVEAELLLAHALDRPRSWFYAHGGDVLGEPELRASTRCCGAASRASRWRRSPACAGSGRSNWR